MNFLFFSFASVFLPLVAVGASSRVASGTESVPKDDPDNSLLIGSRGEFFRYHTITGHEKPSQDNVDRSLALADEVRCEICETLLTQILKNAKSLSDADEIYDLLEGHQEKEFKPTGDEQRDRIEEHKRGCNKHFKDEFVFKGYQVRNCDDEKPNGDICVKKMNFEPGKMYREAYDVEKEAVFYACQHTIGTYPDEITEVILEKGLKGIKKACIAAKCVKPKYRKKTETKKGKKEKKQKTEF